MKIFAHFIVPLPQVPHPNCEDNTPQFKGEITKYLLQYPLSMKMPAKCFWYKQYKGKENVMLFK